MKDKIVYEGNLFQVIHRTKKTNFKVGKKEVSKTLKYEFVRRPPGVRALIVNDMKLLLSREFRYELNDWDYRLPGGKVYDSNEEYSRSFQLSSIYNDIVARLKQEVFEEVNIEIKQYKMLNISRLGLTVEWDLYYFLIDDFTMLQNNSVQKSEFEFIEPRWVDYPTALKLCLNGKVSESRSAYEIMRFILNTEQGE